MACDDAPPPVFASAREFGLWALNAPGLTIDQKLRAMQTLAMIEAKGADAKKQAPVADDADDRLYKPRPAFRVVV